MQLAPIARLAHRVQQVSPGVDYLGDPSTMAQAQDHPLHEPLETLTGIVERVTFHSRETGWAVLKVAPFSAPHTRVAVTVHQTAVFAGATMEFRGHWTTHPRYGEQFRTVQANERKPASAAALEKYLGSGLIRGVGPKTARKIVKHFGTETLCVFDEEIERLTEVRGIAARRLEAIATSWREHCAIRDVTMFLQTHGISTLFAVRIYQRWGGTAIDVVREDPYRLAREIFGIGFFGADRIARSLGLPVGSNRRVEAAVRHVLSAAREAGHCYLLADQVTAQVAELLNPEDRAATAAQTRSRLEALVTSGDVCVRELTAPTREGDDVPAEGGGEVRAYYARSLFSAERGVAQAVAVRLGGRGVDRLRVLRWLERFAGRTGVRLSDEQRAAVVGISGERLSILTGGPGCGKTTTLRTLVHLLSAMGSVVTLAAPTGRAAQRMGEVVGRPAKTIHRLLEWDPAHGGFRHDADDPLPTDFLVIDEVSMLDISIAHALFCAVPDRAAVLLIGDPDQLPSVGPGNVLRDLLAAPSVPRFRLTRVFRQAEASDIVRSAHRIRRGEVPDPPSPLADPGVWDRSVDCLFLDSEEATVAELKFLRRARAVVEATRADGRARALISETQRIGTLVAAPDRIRVERTGASGVHEGDADVGAAAADTLETFSIPPRFLRVDLEHLAASRDEMDELRAVLRRIHPDSTLHHGISMTNAIEHLYTHTIPQRVGPDADVQILTPMNRGSVGAAALNGAIQAAVNPPVEGRGQLRLGERVLRVGDRVIQRRNNYDLGVFNGDIGTVEAVDAIQLTATTRFGGGDDEGRVVTHRRDSLSDLQLAYAITIHKAQGSEFPAVIIPLLGQHHAMLVRDLVYTALTRARRLAIFVGSRAALARAVRNAASTRRQTALTEVVAQAAAG